MCCLKPTHTHTDAHISAEKNACEITLVYASVCVCLCVGAVVRKRLIKIQINSLLARAQLFPSQIEISLYALKYFNFAKIFITHTFMRAHTHMYLALFFIIFSS